MAIYSYLFGRNSTIEPFYNVKIIAIFPGRGRGRDYWEGVGAKVEGLGLRGEKLVSDSYARLPAIPATSL